MLIILSTCFVTNAIVEPRTVKPMSEIVCSICAKQQATVYYTDVQNGVPHTRKFCVNCAKSIGILDASIPYGDMMKSFDNMMKSFDDAFKSFDLNAPSQTPTIHDITCKDCGMTLSEFKKNGRFGCAKDYELFNVGPTLEKIHGTSQHVGKVPKEQEDRKQAAIKKAVVAITEDLIARLKKQMDDAVKAENYEQAAKLRDEIRGLEK